MEFIKSALLFKKPPSRETSPKRSVSPTNEPKEQPEMHDEHHLAEHSSSTHHHHVGAQMPMPTTTKMSPLVETNSQSIVSEQPYQGYMQFNFQNILNDPTVNCFNRLFSRDTHKLLGLSGIKVSRICLGSMNFGEIDPQYGDRIGQLDEDKAHKILDRFVELGGNCIDTANFFPWFGKTSGESERIIGNWLAK